MALTRTIGRRRAEIRRNRPDRDDTALGWLLKPEYHVALAIAIGFVVATTAILMLRPKVVGWRVGQYAPHDIVARVDFAYHDAEKLAAELQAARMREPRVYHAVADPFTKLREELSTLPDVVQNQRLQQLNESYRSVLDQASLTQIQEFAARSKRAAWQDSVDSYIEAIRQLQLVIIPDDQRAADIDRKIRLPQLDSKWVEETFSPSMREELQSKFAKPTQQFFSSIIAPRILAITLDKVRPNYELDPSETAQAQNVAEARIPVTAGDASVNKNLTFVRQGEIDQSKYVQLKAEHEAYLASLGGQIWLQRLGLAAIVMLLTVVGSMYVAMYQPRIIRNHARALGLAALLVSMLLLAQLTGLGSTRSYIFGLAPTIVVAMILAISYDQRFAIGIAGIHALLATLALGESLDFLVILMTGVMTCCFLLEDVRTRSKLIEVGGATAVAMMVATIAAGWLDMDPFQYILRNAIYSGAAGLAVGFLTLGILPFIERVFRITTSMTLLELADASHPLLRRLAMEAPGTYNHSLQVATLAEEAAEAVGGNSLLCRVASYYHDAGKINKAEYFVENQQQGQNRHLNLSPSVSLLIIIGHVKDGIALAKEYNLPTSIQPFIEQHHGTTLVEFFYHRARKDLDRNDPMCQQIDEHQYRYPGPKPRTKETAIVMLADACESACRAMDEPNANRIETLVHDLTMKRLLDGQFDECELTMRQLELIERSLVKSLLGLYHGRIAYPTESPQPTPVPHHHVPTISKTA